MEFLKDIVDGLKKNSEYKNYAQLYNEAFKKHNCRDMINSYINLIWRLPPNIMSYSLQVLKDVSVKKFNIVKDDQQQINDKLKILIKKQKEKEVCEYFCILFEGNYSLSQIWLAYQDKKMMLEEFYQKDKDMSQQLLVKLQDFYEKQGKQFEQVTDFEEEYLMNLDDKETDYFLEIVMSYEQKKQSQQNKNSLNIYIGNIINAIGNDNIIQTWNSCADDLDQFKKLLKGQKGQQQEISLQILKQIEMGENYYLLIKVLKNYADIENNKIKLKQSELKKFIEISNQKLTFEIKDKKISLGELQKKYDEENGFFNNFQTLKYFYKYLKLRTFQGEKRKERDLKQQLSMRTIALEHILQIIIQADCQQQQKDDLKRHLQQGVSKLMDQIYSNLSKVHTESDFTKLFEVSKQIKEYLIQFNRQFIILAQSFFRFRTLFYILIQMLSKYFQEKPFIDQLIDQCFKYLQIVQQSSLKQKKITDIITKCFSEFTQTDIFIKAFESNNKLKVQFINEFEDKQTEVNLSSKYVMLQIQLITDTIMNLIKHQYITNKVESINKEVYHDIKQIEKIILIESKDHLSQLEKLKQFYLKKIKIDLFAGDILSKQKKEDLFHTISKQYFDKLKIMQRMMTPESISQEEIHYTSKIFKEYFYNPEIIYQQLMLKYQNNHSKYLHQIINNFDFEKKLKDEQERYIDIFISRTNSKSPQQIKNATDMFLNFKQSMLRVDNIEFTVYRRFFFSQLIYASIYIQKEIKFVSYCVEIFDKIRFLAIGFELNNRKINYQDSSIYIQIDKIISQESIEDQFKIAQKTYNYLISIFNVYNEKQQLNYWDPDIQFVYDPSKVNSFLYNQTLVGMSVINQMRYETKTLQRLNEFDVFFKLKTIPQLQHNQQLVLSSLINQLVELTKSKKELMEQLVEYENQQQNFVNECKQLLAKAQNKPFLIKNFIELKNKYELEFKPDELYYKALFYWEDKSNQDKNTIAKSFFQQNRDKIQKKIDSSNNQQLANQIDQSIKILVDESKQPQIQIFYEKYLHEFRKYMKISTSHLGVQQQVQDGQIRQPVTRRPIQLLKIDILRNRLKEKSAYYQIGLGNNNEEQEKLLEFIVQRFTEYMKWFISRILQALTVQKEGDEFKVYQVRQQIQQAEGSQEQLIKQLTDIYQTYGPKKEGFYNTTLLTSQQQVSMQYALCDMTPMEKWNDYNESLLQLDLQREKKMVEEVGSGLWREQRQELNDVLRKKVKRGTELWDEIKVFLGGQQIEKNDQEDIVQSESEDEMNGLVDYNQKMIEKTRNQMRNRLKNMESNNHLMKQKEITIKTVQFVLESLPQYKQSWILQKAYLF